MANLEVAQGKGDPRGNVSCLTIVQGLKLCTMLVRIGMPEFYSSKSLFFVVYNYFSSLCHIDVNGCVLIRKIHLGQDDFICIYNE